jgi:hypothetical protein
MGQSNMDNPEKLATWTHKTQDKQKTQHNMCWTTLYTRNKTKNTMQYVLDNTILKKQNKKHNTICVAQHYTKETKQKTQCNMC